LRNLRPTGRSQFAEALFNAIRFVNLNRVQTGIENYGYGRYPTYSEQVVFVAVVDATSDSARKNFVSFIFNYLINHLSTNVQLQNGKFPKPLPAVGAELTDEPFRWDHKLFVVCLNLPSHPPQRVIQPAPHSNERKQIDLIVEKMNGNFKLYLNIYDNFLFLGKAFELSSHKSTNSIIEGILQRSQQNGVFVKFDRFGPAPNTIQSNINGGM
jgi:hypothetical protein